VRHAGNFESFSKSCKPTRLLGISFENLRIIRNTV